MKCLVHGSLSGKHRRTNRRQQQRVQLLHQRSLPLLLKFYYLQNQPIFAQGAGLHQVLVPPTSFRKTKFAKLLNGFGVLVWKPINHSLSFSFTGMILMLYYITASQRTNYAQVPSPRNGRTYLNQQIHQTRMRWSIFLSRTR